MAAKYWRKKVILAKLESTYGTDPTPTGAADAVRAKNVRFNPQEGGDKDLGHETPYMGANATIAVDLHGTLEFDVDLVGSGTAGTAPAFGALLRGCGMAETIVADTSVTYNPISAAFESLTLYLNVDGILYTMTGARGTCTIEANASSEPLLRFKFTALYTAPSDAGAPTPTLTGWLDPKVVSDRNTPTFTIAGSDRILRSMTLDLGNTVEPRFLVNHEEIVISDRAEMLQMQVEAAALAAFNPYALAEAGTRVAIVLQHEATAGRIITLSVPTAQAMRPGTPTEAQGITEWPLSFKPLPALGNDQFTLAFT